MGRRCPAQRHLAVYADGKTFVFNDAGDEQSLTRALEVFLKAVKDRSRDLSSLKSGVDVVAILERCQKALK